MTQTTILSGTEGLRSSGTSPGLPTLHLLGPGRVGRAFLHEIDPRLFRLVAVTDSSGTAYRRDGFDPLALARHKEVGLPVAGLDEAQCLPAELAVRLVGADLLVDATPTDPARARKDLERTRHVLRSGSGVALASKAALALAPRELLSTGRVGANAALGGTGARLERELPTLRESCRAVALVANATTTALIEAYERGEDRETALAGARSRGLLEADPSLDLDGTDLAIKLTIVAGAVFGRPIDPGSIPREGLEALDPHFAWWRAQRGRTTRLVARASRSGAFSVSLEELPRSSPLAVPSDRVAYAYVLEGGGTRVHVGWGIGPRGTALALLADLEVLSAKGGAS